GRSPASVVRGLADYEAPDELAVLRLGEPVCLLFPLNRFLGEPGVPTLSFEVRSGEFVAPPDSFDGRVDGFELSEAGAGFLRDGFGFPTGFSGELVMSDVVPDEFGVPADESIVVLTGFLGVASARGRSV